MQFCRCGLTKPIADNQGNLDGDQHRQKEFEFNFRHRRLRQQESRRGLRKVCADNFDASARHLRSFNN